MSDITTLVDILEPVRGITAVIGGGGKSTLLARGGRALSQRGHRVALATSTHMLPVDGLAYAETLEELAPEARRAPLIQLGRLEASTGKLTAPAEPWDSIAAAADYVLVEADGSRGLPFKAHSEREPQIPSGCARVIYIAGATGFGLPIYDVVHRPQLFRDLLGVAIDELASPELIAAGIVAEGLVGMPDDLVIVNQAERPGAQRDARALAAALTPLIDCPVFAGSLRDGELVRLA